MSEQDIELGQFFSVNYLKSILHLSYIHERVVCLEES